MLGLSGDRVYISVSVRFPTCTHSSSTVRNMGHCSAKGKSKFKTSFKSEESKDTRVPRYRDQTERYMAGDRGPIQTLVREHRQALPGVGLFACKICVWLGILIFITVPWIPLSGILEWVLLESSSLFTKAFFFVTYNSMTPYRNNSSKIDPSWLLPCLPLLAAILYSGGAQTQLPLVIWKFVFVKSPWYSHTSCSDLF